MAHRRLAPPPASPAPAIPDLTAAFDKAIALARGNKVTRARRAANRDFFIHWLADRYPDVQSWSDLLPSMLIEYARELETRGGRSGAGRAYDTIRHRLDPIRLAWRMMAQDYPDQVRAWPRLKLKREPRQAISMLPVDQIVRLLKWSSLHAPNFYPIFCLQTLAGLRILEATHLRFEDVDMKAGTITIADTACHQPKTFFSYRTLPVCAAVRQALRWVIASRAKRTARGAAEPFLFISRRGHYCKAERISTALKATLDRAGAALKIQFPEAKKLRASFSTLASDLKVRDDLLIDYVGHENKNARTLDRSYRTRNAARLTPIPRAIDRWMGKKLTTPILRYSEIARKRPNL